MAQENIDIRINTKIDQANTETDLKKLRGILKELQSLGEEVGTTSESFDKIAAAANVAEGRIGDASDRLKTITGEPLEKVSNGFNLMGEGLSNLDFGKAKIGIDGITAGIKGMNLKGLGTGLKDVTGSFLKLGAAIATNPIFLLATTIILIIKNFDKLKAAGGAVGAMFNAIGDAIKFATDMAIRFSDALGLTSIKANEVKEATKEAQDSTEEYYNTVIDGEIAINEAMGKSTLADEYLKQNRVIEASINKLKELYEAERIFIDVVELKKKTQDLGIQQLKDYISETYGIVKGGYEAINKLEIELEKREILKKKNQDRIVKENEERTKKDISIQNNLIKDGAVRRGTILTEEYVNEDNEIKKQLEKRKEDIRANDKDDTETKKNLYIELSNKLRKTQIDFNKWEKDWNKRQSSEAFKLLSEDTKNRIIQIEEGKRKEFEASIAAQKKNNENAGIIFDNARRVTNDKEIAATVEFEKTRQLKAAEYAKGLSQIWLEERIKGNQRLLDSNKHFLDKQMVDDDKNWAQKIDAENGFFNKELELQNKQLKLQLQKDGLTNEDRLKLRQDYAFKTEQLTKEHVDRVAKLYEDSGIGINKRIKTSIDELNQLVSDSINTTSDKIISAEEKRLADLETTQNTELAMLQSHLDMTGGIRLRQEKKLIEDSANARMQSMELARQRELASVEKGSEEALVIEKKYAALENKLIQEKEQAKIQATVNTINTIAGYAESAQEAASLMADLASNKDKDRLKNGEITEEQFQRKEFNRKKALNIANIVMNTAEAISKSVALSPATGGLPFSAIAAAIGALQFAKVTSTTFQYASPATTGGVSVGSAATTKATDLAVPGNPYFGQGFLNMNTFNGMNGNFKVYVLEQDIRNALNRASVLNNRNSF